MTPSAVPSTVLWLGVSRPDTQQTLQERSEIAVRFIRTFSTLLGELKRWPSAVCVVDLIGGRKGLDRLRNVRAAFPRRVILAVVDRNCPETVCQAFELGAFDVLPAPVTAADVEAAVHNAEEFRRLATATPAEASNTHASNGFVAVSESMRKLLELVPRLGAAQCHVLLTGEPGTGRETVAALLHKAGRRSRARFVRVDGASIGGAELLARLDEAEGGTVYLQNVADMPLPQQARLAARLRAEGGPRSHRARVIAAAAPRIADAVADGSIRDDLFELLSLVRVDLPPLRARREDIPLLTRQLLADICAREGLARKSITRPAMTLLERLPWRRNISDLRALLERLVVWVPGGVVCLEDVLEHVALDGGEAVGWQGGTSLREAREQFEREYIAATLRRHRGRMPEAARALGMQRTNLYRKIRVLKLSRPGV